MAKLSHPNSVRIVEGALRTVRESQQFSSQTRLGEILLTSDETAQFRTHVHNGVRAEGFHIDLERIPAEPHFTIEHVASAVRSLSGLAGDSGIDDESLSEGLAGDPGIDDLAGDSTAGDAPLEKSSPGKRKSKGRRSAS